jgi:uncharacterized protein DUF1566
MHKRIICLFTLIFMFPVCVVAGTIQLPQTGQTKCYDTTGAEISCAGTGQDGNLRAGVAWPNPRFSVSGDCVTDNLTGLMWAGNGSLAGTRTWQGALDWVDSLNSGGGLCGYTDWRLPNRKELKSLVNRQQANSASWLNSQGFNNVQEAGWYWSSSTSAYGTGSAWLVYMYVGYVLNYPKTGNVYYVWPVRSGQ